MSHFNDISRLDSNNQPQLLKVINKIDDPNTRRLLKNLRSPPPRDSHSQKRHSKGQLTSGSTPSGESIMVEDLPSKPEATNLANGMNFTLGNFNGAPTVAMTPEEPIKYQQQQAVIWDPKMLIHDGSSLSVGIDSQQE